MPNDIVSQAKEAVLQLAKVRKEFLAGKMAIQNANTFCGLCSVTSRMINTQISAEKWTSRANKSAKAK